MILIIIAVFFVAGAISAVLLRAYLRK